MIVVGDIGNSRQKWGRIGSGGIVDTVALLTADAAGLSSVFAGYARQPVDRLLVSSVAAESVRDDVCRAAKDAGLPVPEFAEIPPDGHGPGVTLGYREPAQLGIDRYLAMLAARQRHASSVIVVDVGTAVTIDAVDDRGVHRGGAILPGLRLMHDALARGTHGIRAPRLSSNALFGRDTAECVAIGTLHAIAGGIESLVEPMAEALGSTPQCILTGGDASAVEPLLKARYHSHPDLVLEGLAIHAGV